MLQTLLQSYQNVSNSQQKLCRYETKKCCKRFCKVIKMLAIHNIRATLCTSLYAANAFAKLSKCQQFTTELINFMKANMLQTLLQSYQNVSNSQLISKPQRQLISCKRFCKVIKMLAIHNYAGIIVIVRDAANAFAKLSKCQQFTTNRQIVSICYCCKRFCKVIKMLAIHN